MEEDNNIIINPLRLGAKCREEGCDRVVIVVQVWEVECIEAFLLKLTDMGMHIHQQQVMVE